MERIDDGPVKLQDVDCKIEWKEWSEWSACDDGYEYRERTGKIVQLPMGRGSPCPEDKNDEYTYNYSNRTARQIERRMTCSSQEETEEEETEKQMMSPSRESKMGKQMTPPKVRKKKKKLILLLRFQPAVKSNQVVLQTALTMKMKRCVAVI